MNSVVLQIVVVVVFFASMLLGQEVAIRRIRRKWAEEDKIDREIRFQAMTTICNEARESVRRSMVELKQYQEQNDALVEGQADGNHERAD